MNGPQHPRNGEPASGFSDGAAPEGATPPPRQKGEREGSRSSSKAGRDQPIGRILVDAGRLSATDAQRIAQFAAESKIRFGEAALQLDLVKRGDIAFALGRQFSFHHLDRNDPSLSQDLVAAYEPEHPLVEQLRELRMQITSRAATQAHQHPMVAIVSADRGDGRSFLAANLAVVFAQIGLRTLLIDADLRNPSQHRYFRCDNRIGLSTVLSGRSGVECLHRVPAFPRIHLMTAGPTPPNPLELLERPAFAQLLASADANFSAVIVDTPAASIGADARLVGNRVGANVIVARSNHTRTETGQRLLRSMSADQTKVIGVVLNDAR